MRKPKSEKLLVSMSEDERRMAIKLAEAEGVSLAQMFRTLLRKAFDSFQKDQAA